MATRIGYVRSFKHWPEQKQIDTLVEAGVDRRRIYVEDYQSENIATATGAVRKGEALEVVELRALGDTREKIADAFGNLKAKGAGVFEVTTGLSSFDDGIAMYRRALRRIHGEASSPSIAEMRRRAAKGGAERAKRARVGRMPKGEALPIWRNELLSSDQAAAEINADDNYDKKWSRAALYRELGPRDVIPGRRPSDYPQKVKTKRRKAHKGGMVYFMRCGGRGAVKIGFSLDADARMADHQVSNSGKLQLIAAMPGTMADEKALHKRFAKERTNGEWFKMSPRLKAFIASLPRDYF